MSAAPTRPRWWWYLPIALLIGVACRQVVLARTAGLVPWSGGGFGMFATTDGWGTRALQVRAVRPDVRRELDLPVELPELARHLRAYPSEQRARRLAGVLAELPTPDAGPLQAIEVQVWATDHDRVTLRPSPRLVRSFRIPFAHE